MLNELASWFPGRLLASVLLSFAAAVGNAENLVSMQTRAIPVFAGEHSALLVASDVPVVAQGNTLWQLDDTAEQWIRLAWRSTGHIVGSIQNGPQVYLLVEAQAGRGISQVTLYPEQNSTSAAALPVLPLLFSQAKGAVLDSTLYLAGVGLDGRSHWLSIDLKSREPIWRTLLPWGSSSSGVAAVVAQDSALYVSVRQPEDHRDRLWRWTVAAGWSDKGPLPGAVVEGAARAMGQAHILMLIRSAPGADPNSQFITYHTTTGSISTQGTAFPDEARSGIGWRNGILWEHAAPDISNTIFSLSEIEGRRLLLRPLDWVMIVIYLIGIAGIGVYCYRREKKQSTSEFFVGSRTIPFWAAGISLYATNSSSIGYIATTAKAYATNWQYLLNNLLAAVALIFVAIGVVPMLRRLELMSVYNYLEQRFHPSVRMAASGFCILMHLGGRVSVVLFLPSLAISTVTGLSVVWSILLMGTVTIGYTALGGMRAVIWTDLVQVLVKVGGLIFALVIIISSLHGGMSEFFSAAMADNKMKLLDWHFNLTEPTVWSILFLVIVEVVLTFPKDQVMMQRVFTTKSAKEAGRSVWVFAVLIIPGSCLFYLIGTGLYVFYQSHPERMNPLLSIDATFPLFIAAELPAGITGLMIAGLFSAAMATISSILNSVATLISVDFYEKLARKPDPTVSIRLAEWITVVAGFIGIGLALMLSLFDIKSFIDVAAELWGLLGGTTGGAYTLGMFSRRANWQGVLIGMIAAFGMTFAAWTMNLVHPLLYVAVSSLVSIVVGYAASWFFPAPETESLLGLTILNQRDNLAET